MSRRVVGVAIAALVALCVAAAAVALIVARSGALPLGLAAAEPWTTAASVTSASLARDMPIQVFQPPAAASCPAAPVLVVFHGRGGDETQWMGGSLLSPGVGVDSVARGLIEAGRIEPVTIVSASIDDSYGVDSVPASDGYDHGPYGRYISDELLPAVEQRYSNLSGGERPLYVAGLSMGGYAALNVALANPGRFAGVGALSPAFFVTPPAERAWMYTANGSSSLFDRIDAGAADGLRVFLGTGASDYSWITASTRNLSDQLDGRGVNVETTTATGGHEVGTWRALAGPMLLKLFATDANTPC